MQSDFSPTLLNEKLRNSTACYFMKKYCSEEQQAILTEKRIKQFPVYVRLQPIR